MKLRFAPAALALLRTPPLIAASSVFEMIASFAQNAGTASSQPGTLAIGDTGGSLSEVCLTNMIAMQGLQQQSYEDYTASCAEEANIVIDKSDNATLTNSTVSFSDGGLCDRSIVEAFCESLDYDMANFGYRYELERVETFLVAPETIFTVKDRAILIHEADCMPKGCPQILDWSAEDYIQLKEAFTEAFLGPPSPDDPGPPPGYELKLSIKQFEGPKDTGDTAKSAKSAKGKGAKKAKSSKR